MDPALRTLIGVIIGLIIGIGIGVGVIGSKTTIKTITSPVTTTLTKTIESAKTVTMEAQVEYNVKLAYSPEKGLYLVDSKGMTLYFFAKDYDGKSHCYGQCAVNWPPFYVDKIKPGPGLDPMDFNVITRDDGKKQVTYKGWPLYYFFKDKKPGDMMGDGVKNVWFVAKPDYTVMIAVKEGIGSYLVDDKGMTLYFFKKDEAGKSNCYGQCAMNWPVFTPSHLIIPSTLNIQDFSYIVRDDGKIQLTYKGHPLYYWINDKMRGDTTGQGVKDVWYVAYTSGQIP